MHLSSTRFHTYLSLVFLISLPILLTNCEEPQPDFGAVQFTVNPTEGKNYRAVSLELNYMSAVYSDGSYTSFYTSPDQEACISSLDYEFDYSSRDAGATVYTYPAELSAVSPNFGYATLEDLRTGELVQVWTQSPGSLKLSRNVAVKKDGIHEVELTFNPDNVHDENGTLMLSFAESKVQPVAAH